MLLEWAQAGRALPGQSENGDAVWIQSDPQKTRVVVIDGLGHGHEAAAAAGLAMESLKDLGQLSLEETLTALDKALARSRGAAMSIADIYLGENSLVWSGVGNVEGVLSRDSATGPIRERLLMQSGIVGNRLPHIQVRKLALKPGDHLLFHTDGIRPDVITGLTWGFPPQETAQAMLKAYAKDADDAMIWLGRLHG